MFGARRSLFMLMLCTLYVLNLSVSVKKNIFVGLTRTAGMNKQLSSELLKCNQQTGAYKFNCMELPCISYQDNIGNLKQLCNNINKYDYIIVTSPKAAKILMDVRSHLNSSGVKYISIGSGTSIILKNHNIIPVFELNGADVSATALGRELPLEYKGASMMYACSSQADDKLVNILKERGFDRICRVNLYETLPNKWTSSMKTIANNHVDIATFASPTAIKGWLLNDGRLDIPISVIGRTTYEYAKQNGFKHILCELDEKQENVFTNVREENVDSKSIIQKWAKSMVKYVENNQ